MLRKLTIFLLMQLALFVFISQSAFSAELITNPQLKEWIKSNTDQLPEVVINEDGGIDSTTANLEALAKIEQLDCSNFELTSIDELIVNMLNLKMLICRHTSLTELDVTKKYRINRIDLF
jgi:Leucine-rich repeat (LRR) protein